MASCSYCNSFILFGGRTDATGRYCNERCQQAGNLLAVSQQVSPQEMAALIREVHEGKCPRCGRPGPVDMHKAHRVWSAMVVTSWSSSPELSCKSCATKRQLGGILFSAILGWWGFPWGLVMTPIQIVKNIGEMVGGPKAGQPSALLQKFVRLQVGAALLHRPRPQPNGPPAPPQDDTRYQPPANVAA